jgi:hypothetical protein
MFRLWQSENPHGILITIEGELKGEGVGIVESICREALAKNAGVTVLIKNITEIDAEGRSFLKRMAMTKAQMRAIGIYSRYIIGKNVVI